MAGAQNREMKSTHARTRKRRTLTSTRHFENAWSIEKECPEPPGDSSDGCDPDDRGHGGGHQRRHPRCEHPGEQRGQRPHRGLDVPAPGRAAAVALELAEAEEEEDEGGVGAEHEGGGAGVARRVVDGEPRVEGQGAEAEFGQSRGTAPAVWHSTRRIARPIFGIRFGGSSTVNSRVSRYICRPLNL